MRSIVDDAITEIQDLVQRISSVNIKAAPEYPIESADILPMGITHITGGTGQADNASTARLLLNISTDIHLDRSNMGMAYRQVNSIIPEFLKLLAGNPTLGGQVETIIFPVTVTVQPAEWDRVFTQMIRFDIPIKFMEEPTT